MNKQNLIRKFFQEVEKGNYNGVVQMFSPGSLIHSPLYGSVSASQFYKDLAADTESVKVHIKNIFINVDNPHSAAVHIVFTWERKNNELAHIDCVDIFEFTSNDEKIQLLTIIYDTYKMKEDLKKK